METNNPISGHSNCTRTEGAAESNAPGSNISSKDAEQRNDAWARIEARITALRAGYGTAEPVRTNQQLRDEGPCDNKVRPGKLACGILPEGAGEKDGELVFSSVAGKCRSWGAVK